MLILGIETSCDETGVALYQRPQGLRAHRVYSQAEFFADYGGVVPELASRDHLRCLLPLIHQLCEEAATPIATIDAIAYTQGPGLGGALLVGSALAEALAYTLNKPAIPIHHLEGHILSPLLSISPLSDEVLAATFPYLALIVSGGHSQLVVVRGVGDYEIVGDSRDDAAGEAFDKSAQLLGFPYPGGAALSALANQGDPGRFHLPRPMLHSDDFDFSFSGLKTAVLQLVKTVQDKTQYPHIARAFVEAVVEVLVTKSVKAAQHYGLSRLVVVGGVSANLQLRAAMKKAFPGSHFPELTFCSDNGAMIALAGALRYQVSGSDKEQPQSYVIAIKPRWPLHELSPPGLAEHS